MEILAQYHIEGLVIGLITFLIIGTYHPIVIKAEYYFGVKCWWAFLLLGIAGAVVSVVTDSIYISIIGGVFSFTSFWGIKEVFEQRQRVLRGWFPKNPKRLSDYEDSPRQEACSKPSLK